MMRWKLAAAFIAVCGHAHASNDALLEACNALPDPARRLECFKQAAAKAATHAPSAAPHAALRDALVAFDGQIAQGISLVNYNQAMLAPAREMALFEKNNPSANPQAIGALRSALQAYGDASTFWRASISTGAKNRGIFTSSTMTLDDMTGHGIVDLVGKYSLPTRGTGPFGAWTGVAQADGVSTIWAFARKAHQEAFDLLDGKVAAPAPEPNQIADDGTPAIPTKACPQDVLDRLRSNSMTEESIKRTCGR